MKLRNLFRRKSPSAADIVREFQKIEVQQKVKSPIDLVHEAAVQDSFETFRDQMEQALLYPQKTRIRTFAIERAMDHMGADGLYVEFGVYRADGLNHFAKKLKKLNIRITGFDSLQGLSEDWTGHYKGRESGAYSVGGKIPDIADNADFRAGWVEDTLPGFLEEHPDTPISFAHMDFDTYTPTAFALQQIKPRLRPGSILLFDELYGYPGWRHHEYKALVENLEETEYRYLSFSREAVAIEITDGIKLDFHKDPTK